MQELLVSAVTVTTKGGNTAGPLDNDTTANALLLRLALSAVVMSMGFKTMQL